MRSLRVLLRVAPLFLLALGANSQAVVSATAGVLQFFEGAVTIDDHPMERKAASFPAIKNGSTLRTHKGRAEVLLSPGFYLRLDENSAVRMISNALTDTRLELLSGSAIVDSLEARPDSPVVLSFKETKMRFPAPGVYRIDADTGVLQAYSGKAEVDGVGGKSAELDQAHLYFFEVGVQTDKITDGTEDEFYDWARDRNEAISAENQLAAQNNGDPGDAGVDPNFAGALPPVPYATPPNYTYQAPYANGNYWGSFQEPYLGYGMGPYGFYSPFPLVVLVRPNGHYLWPHRTLPGVTTGLGYRTGIGGSIVRPYQPRTATTVRGPSFVAPSAPRPATTAAPRAMPLSVARPAHR